MSLACFTLTASGLLWLFLALAFSVGMVLLGDYVRENRRLRARVQELHTMLRDVDPLYRRATLYKPGDGASD